VAGTKVVLGQKLTTHMSNHQAWQELTMLFKDAEEVTGHRHTVQLIIPFPVRVHGHRDGKDTILDGCPDVWPNRTLKSPATFSVAVL
jgi:hypothetical protein